MTWGLFLNKSSLEDSAQEGCVCLTGKNTIHYQPRHKAKVSSYPSRILSWKKNYILQPENERMSAEFWTISKGKFIKSSSSPINFQKKNVS